MSSYLLLRNNKESGPFTMDEIKGMSLKPYDLLWAVGKSAAWRYPGEMPEFKSFAPPVPEELNDGFNKKRNTENISDNGATAKKDEPANTRTWENKPPFSTAGRSVYVNLPAEKRTSARTPSLIVFDEESFSSGQREQSYDFSGLYKKKPTGPAVFSGKVLWISTIMLLFGAGILTGLFISDRRKFFSTDANHPQSGTSVQPAVITIKKEISPIPMKTGQQDFGGSTRTADSLQSAKILSSKFNKANKKKNPSKAEDKKDSLVSQASVPSSPNLNDSLKQNPFSDTEILYQKIRSHPENYINLVTGRYSTGVFGGISSFPVSITNNSPVTMDLVVVHIDYIQNNQKIFKTESLSLNDLEPGETVTLRAPKSPRGVKVVTRIQVVNSRQLNLSLSH